MHIICWWVSLHLCLSIFPRRHHHRGGNLKSPSQTFMRLGIAGCPQSSARPDILWAHYLLLNWYSHLLHSTLVQPAVIAYYEYYWHNRGGGVSLIWTGTRWCLVPCVSLHSQSADEKPDSSHFSAAVTAERIGTSYLATVEVIGLRH